MKSVITTIRRCVWMIHGMEIGNYLSTFENIYVTDHDMTEKEVIQAIQAEYMEEGYIVTSASFYDEEEMKIDLLNKEIIN